MECSNSNGKEIVVDVESGGRVLGFNGSSEVEGETSLRSKSDESVKLLIEKNPNGLESQDFTPAMDKRCEKERSKIGKTKKAPKPPRPPKGPTLDATDMKLMKEISVIATKRRERAERMKALKKIRMGKSSSSSPSSCGTIPAMIITILFCLVIIFQGLGSKSSSTAIFSGAPEPAMMNKGLISIEFRNNGFSSDDRVPSSNSPYSGEELSGLDLRSED